MLWETLAGLLRGPISGPAARRFPTAFPDSGRRAPRKVAVLWAVAAGLLIAFCPGLHPLPDRYRGGAGPERGARRRNRPADEPGRGPALAACHGSGKAPRDRQLLHR